MLRSIRVAVVLAALALTAGTGLVGPATALAAGPDKAEVVLVLDFSSSILDDEATRNRFGAALERIADRVDETQRDLIAGDTKVSVVQFASKAADVERCSDLKLLGSPSAVRRFADCLRTVAAAYRQGGNPALAKRIGVDTNYVAAMEAAAAHLPADAARPTIILFSDGKHDVPGVPVSEVPKARDRLFKTRTPFALLPVGMGLSAADRPALEAGLAGLKIINAMPPCASGATIEWPGVVFQTPDEAGNAVAVALQDATCTFTVAPTAPPTAGSVVRSIRLKPLDGAIEVTWGAPAPGPDPIVGYRVRCAPAGGDPVDSGDGPALDRKAVVNGLTNGTEYTCEVAADTSTKQGDWTLSGESATPSPLPAAPEKPAVTGGNRALNIKVPSEDSPAVTGYHYECSSDDGKTWPNTADVEVGGGSTTTDTSTQIGGLTNGTAYRCRAFAVGPSGQSEASPVSDAVRACSNVLECNGVKLPVIAAIGGILVGALLLALYFLFRGRGGGYVVAVVDTVHSANLGGGSDHRIGIEWAPGGRRVERVVKAKGGKADFRIHKQRGDRFKVRDRDADRVVASGEPIVVVDSTGVHHELVLWAFSGKAASAVSTRR